MKRTNNILVLSILLSIRLLNGVEVFIPNVKYLVVNQNEMRAYIEDIQNPVVYKFNKISSWEVKGKDELLLLSEKLKSKDTHE